MSAGVAAHDLLLGDGHHAARARVDNVQAIVNLALSRGMVGRPGGGLLPIRGHSNVQGVGSVGVSPALKAEFAERLQRLYGIELPRAPGLHTLASVEVYFPEANVLIPRRIDPASGTPVFKSAAARIEAVAELLASPLRKSSDQHDGP